MTDACTAGPILRFESRQVGDSDPKPGTGMPLIAFREEDTAAVAGD